MDVSKIIEIGRKWTATSTQQISDNDMLGYLNVVYKDVFSRLKNNDSNYTWNRWETNIVANQNEYILPKPSNTDTGVSIVYDVYVNYGNGARKAIMYTEHTDILNQLTIYNPGVIIRDGSVFLYPTPKESVNNGLVVEGRYVPQNLSLNSTSSEIKLPEEYHQCLLFGLCSYVFGEKNVFDKQELFRVRYEEAIQNIKKTQITATQDVFFEEQVDLSDYE